MMNKVFLTGFLASLFCCAYAQNTLSNFDLEEWTTSDSGLYEEPNAPWKTANPAVDFAGGAAVNPVEKTTDAYSGNYAVKMESATIFFTFTAGALWTGDFEINITDPTKSAQFGVPYEGTPTNVQFYYKYFPVNGDSMGIYTILRKWNPTTQQQDTIAYAEVRQSETTDEYTLFDLELDYFIPNIQPDSIEIAFTSSAAGFEYMGQIGSRLFVDEVKLIDFVGITDVLTQEVKVSTSPNPATDHLQFGLGKTKKIIYPSELFFFLYVSLNLPYVARLCASNLAKHIKKITSSFGVDYFLPLPLDKTIPNAQLLIFDAMGRQINTLIFTTNTPQLDVSAWQSGTYYFLLKNEKGQDLSSGKFLIK